MTRTSENAKNVVDVAISNNAPFIMFYRNLDEIVDYAWDGTGVCVIKRRR